ncbi:MAG: VWA domain-containing protein [Verrucomicrobiae bacterium]|nr:VWA domain-containing protein [Verrucomicrobiae bacterium]
MQDTLHFAQPVWIYAGIAICAGLLIAFRQFERSRKAALAKFASPGIVQRLLAGVSDRKRYLKRGLFLVGVALLFLALARPQFGSQWQEVKRRGIDIVFALDTSRSMLAEDVSPSRLERAKLGMMDFVEKLQGDRVGLIPFAGSAFTLCPLTLDYDAFHQSLEAANTDIIPHKGTDLASAIREAESLFAESGNNHKFLVLITDGEDLKGDALTAAQKANDEGMKIFTVGVGSAAGELIPVRGSQGQDFLKDASGQPVRSALDESMLTQIAQATGAIYAPFGQGAEGLQTIYREKLSLVPKDELHQRMQQVAIERFEWPLGAALLCFLLRYLLGDRKRPPLSSEHVVTAGRRTRLPATGLALILFTSLTWISPEAASAQTPDPRVTYNDATTAYQRGDYTAAKEGLQATLATDDLSLQNRGYYNLGNTLFREGSQSIQTKPEDTIARWEESIKAYEGAIALNPADADAQYNRDLVQKKLDALKQRQQEQKQKEDQQQKEENQKKNEDGGGDKHSDNDQADKPSDGSKSEEGKDGSNSDTTDTKEDDGAKKSSEEQQKGGEQEQTGEKEPKPDDSTSGKQKPESAKQEPKSDQGNPAEKKPDQPAKSATEADGEQTEPKEQGEAAPVGERRNPGEMTPGEAAQLLDSLKDDEDDVIFAPARQQGRFRDPNNTTNGKDW